MDRSAFRKDTVHVQDGVGYRDRPCEPLRRSAYAGWQSHLSKVGLPKYKANWIPRLSKLKDCHH